MIVVIGSPLHVPGSGEGPSGAAGLAVTIATAAAALDHEVQLVGRVGEDPAGDATLLALSRAGVGHAATLRDPAGPTPAAPAYQFEPDDRIADIATTDAIDESAAVAAVIRSATLDQADVELALRYLADPSVIVVAEPLDAGALRVAADAASYAGATLIVIVGQSQADLSSQADLDGAIVLGAPTDDPDGVFGQTVGAFAAALDAGEDPRTALEDAVAASGWEPAGT